MTRTSAPESTAAATTRASSTRPPPGTTPADRLQIAVVHSPDAGALGSRLGFDRPLLVVGRDIRDGGLTIADGELSRTHFRIAFDGRSNAFRLGDARSRNGTFVDGRRVDSEVLEDGDVVRAGETVFVFGSLDRMSALRERVARLATTDLSVLLQGETGCGKERIARSIHEQSGRAGDFIAVNCATLPSQIATSELFGHTRGAFSGAVNAREGLFAAAHRGTLFLDEVADLAMDVQGVLLRALEERRVRSIGSEREVPVDVRVLAASHARLDDAVRAGRFREDLFARLAQLVLSIPPLRARRADILGLALELTEPAHPIRLSADAAEALVRYDWPRNVRELRSVVQGAAVLNDSDLLDLEYLDAHHPEITSGFRNPGASSVGSAEPDPRDRAALESGLRKHGGNVTKLAKELGKPRSQVYRWLNALGLDPDRFR